MAEIPRLLESTNAVRPTQQEFARRETGARLPASVTEAPSLDFSTTPCVIVLTRL